MFFVWFGLDSKNVHVVEFKSDRYEYSSYNRLMKKKKIYKVQSLSIQTKNNTNAIKYAQWDLLSSWIHFFPIHQFTDM